MQTQGSPQIALAKLEPPPPQAEAVRDYGSALRSLMDRSFLGTTRHQEQHYRANREGAHPDLLEFEKRFIAKLRKLDVPIFASEVVRDGHRQNELYVQGKSHAKAGQSPHQFGCAVDLVHGVKGWEIHRDSWAMLGHIGLEISVQAGIGIEWGGHWSFYDPAHWELRLWKDLKERFPFSETL